MLLRLFVAASSSFRAFSVQHNSKLWSLASWQKSDSWHHTCNSTTASDQLHLDAMLTSLRWRERVRSERVKEKIATEGKGEAKEGKESLKRERTASRGDKVKGQMVENKNGSGMKTEWRKRWGTKVWKKAQGFECQRERLSTKKCKAILEPK